MKFEKTSDHNVTNENNRWILKISYQLIYKLKFVKIINY